MSVQDGEYVLLAQENARLQRERDEAQNHSHVFTLSSCDGGNGCARGKPTGTSWTGHWCYRCECGAGFWPNETPEFIQRAEAATEMRAALERIEQMPWPPENVRAIAAAALITIPDD